MQTRHDDAAACDVHLAQINLMRAVAPIDSPAMSGFAEQIAPIHELAERSAGFVWRLEPDDDTTMGMPAFADGHLLVNLSVWESMEHLWNFSYASRHLDLLRQRREWTERIATTSLALWWIEAGRTPRLDEALERLDLIEELGPTPAAFTFRMPFPPTRTVREKPSLDPLRLQPGQRSRAGNEGWARGRLSPPAQPPVR